MGESTEWFIAYMLWYGGVAVAIYLGYKAGNLSYKKSRSKLLGWILGIAVFIGLGASMVVFDQLPGVGWKYATMRTSDL